jgi:kynurenine formamidase
MTGDTSQGTTPGSADCDNLAVGAAGSEEDPAHHVLIGSEVCVVEDLDRVPPFCSFVALPLKIRGGLSVRAVALLPGR